MTDTDESDLRQQLALALARIAMLEARVVLLSRRGRQKERQRLADRNKRIHELRLDNVTWFEVGRTVHLSPRRAQDVYQQWKKEHCAELQCSAHGRTVGGRSIAA